MVLCFRAAVQGAKFVVYGIEEPPPRPYLVPV
jgi:hypothetical protein